MADQKSLNKRFYAIRDRHSFSVKKALHHQLGLVWDPWPVNYFRRSMLFSAAKMVVAARSAECVDICVDQIELLPASGNEAGIQGGSQNLPLYSLRSPSMLPFKIHLFEIPVIESANRFLGSDKRTTRIMVRKGQISEPLLRFLSSVGVA